MTTIPPEIEEKLQKIAGQIASKMSRKFGEKLLAFCLKEMTELAEQGLPGNVVAQMAGFELVETALAMFDALQIPYADVTTCIDILRQRFEVEKLHRKGTLTDAERKEMIEAIVEPIVNAKRMRP